MALDANEQLKKTFKGLIKGVETERERAVAAKNAAIKRQNEGAGRPDGEGLPLVQYNPFFDDTDLKLMFLTPCAMTSFLSTNNRVSRGGRKWLHEHCEYRNIPWRTPPPTPRGDLSSSNTFNHA